MVVTMMMGEGVGERDKRERGGGRARPGRVGAGAPFPLLCQTGVPLCRSARKFWASVLFFVWVYERRHTQAHAHAHSVRDVCAREGPLFFPGAAGSDV